MDVTGRVALVTGATSGFGLRACVALARRRMRVFGSARDPARAQSLTSAAAEAGVQVELVRLDVTDRASIPRAVRDVVSLAGRPVDVLVNNAGVGLGGFFEDTSEDELRMVMETNFFGAVALSREVLPSMRDRKWGRIINVSSMSGRMGAPGFTAYSASKWALEGFSEALRYEAAPFGVFVSLIEPGMFKTDIFGRNRKVAGGVRNPQSPYAEVSARFESQVDGLVEKFGGDPQVVAELIARVAAMKRPGLRYLVGKDARAAVVSRAMVPAAMQEWFFNRALKLGGRE